MGGGARRIVILGAVLFLLVIALILGHFRSGRRRHRDSPGHCDHQASYEIELPEGTYNVTLQRSINKTPQQITVTAGETVTVDLTFDIGIR